MTDNKKNFLSFVTIPCTNNTEWIFFYQPLVENILEKCLINNKDEILISINGKTNTINKKIVTCRSIKFSDLNITKDTTEKDFLENIVECILKIIFTDKIIVANFQFLNEKIDPFFEFPIFEITALKQPFPLSKLI